MTDMKKLLIIAGPSAVGKTTLAEYILSNNVSFEYVRSATTRPPRADKHDDEYIYYSKEEFLDLQKSGGMLEYTAYLDNLYGTPKNEIERILSEGKVPLLILDIKGVESIKASGDFASFAVYLYEDIDVLEDRLYRRYIGENATVDGLILFSKRRDRNIVDYLNIEEITSRFDALVQNSDLALASERILTLYKNAKSSDKTEDISRIRQMLERKRKPRY